MTEDIIDWLSEEGFSLMNQKGEITHPPRNGRKQASVLDLSFINGPAAASNIIQEWAVDPGLVHDSDHYAIKFTINHTPIEIHNSTGKKYNLKDVDLEVWAGTMEAELTAAKPTLDTLLVDDTMSENHLDECEQALTTCILNTIAKAGKLHAPCIHAKPWWDKELAEAAERVAKAREDQKRHQDLLDQNTGRTIRSHIKRARNFFKQLCKFKKRDWSTKKLESASSGDIWGFQKWSKGIRNYPSPPIATGEGMPKAISHKEKCEALRQELYQPLPPLETEFNPNLTDRQDNDLPFTPITVTEVEEAIMGASTNSSPGHTQISYQAIKWAWANPTFSRYTTALMQKCLETGYHLKAWHKAIAVALRKPNKPDSNPRAYWQVLKKVIARHLTFLVGKYDLVPDNQFGGRSNSSTADAILTFTNNVHCAWNHGKVTLALTFDIKGYFDFVNHKRLLSEL